MKKERIYIGLAVLAAIILYIAYAGVPTIFSSVNFPGISSSQCEAKNNPCISSEGLIGQLTGCHIGSGNTCYCEFRSYSSGQCPSGKPTSSTGNEGVSISKPATQTKNILGTEIDVGNINILIGVILISALIVYFIKRGGY